MREKEARRERGRNISSESYNTLTHKDEYRHTHTHTHTYIPGVAVVDGQIEVPQVREHRLPIESNPSAGVRSSDDVVAEGRETCEV